MTRRRRFSERDVLAAIHFNHGIIACYRCKGPLEPHQKIEREHLTEIAIGGADEPHNCAYSHADCHSVVTNGTPATSAGSSKHRIAKVRRIRGETKTKPKRRIQSRGFSKGHRPMKKPRPPLGTGA